MEISEKTLKTFLVDFPKTYFEVLCNKPISNFNNGNVSSAITYLIFYFILFSSVYAARPAFFFLPLSLVAAVENALVIIAIWKDPFRQLKGNLANYLIINLAVSDLLISIAAFPLLSLLNWFTDETVVRAAIASGHLAFSVSHLTVLSLAVERLIVVTYPFWSADNLTSSYRIPRIIMPIWFFAGLSAVVPIIRFDLYCSGARWAW